MTIDDTWRRVADTVAAVNGTQAPLWAHRYIDAFSRWRLLPDERLLRCLGTTHLAAADGPPAAALNASSFVEVAFGAGARFNRNLCADTATLAVRLLDDAVLSGALRGGEGLRIGVVGFDDALMKLGLVYTSPHARELARTLALAVAEGCLRGSTDLAEERGPTASVQVTQALATHWRAHGVGETVVERARRCGLRHAPLTAIQRHPLLARLANGSSDALDPAQARALNDEATAIAREAICKSMQALIDLPIEDGPGGDTPPWHIGHSSATDEVPGRISPA
ncbi:glycyl radical enzyme family protein [Agrilutibacter solisilvae]|uniref:Ribonucleotide reductase large subunit C-terminal domain-containing protein n=1 Tax=Agrilutibacter solisilvae TaxID=2763317 RepID=A0A974XZG3_9GAMM|nr:hypothetical protein [Lysobacter solisilvae]QSX77670.1 hypothetical protein I8J32_013085 [Lysobacter solisilvae]